MDYQTFNTHQLTAAAQTHSNINSNHVTILNSNHACKIYTLYQIHIMLFGFITESYYLNSYTHLNLPSLNYQ